MKINFFLKIGLILNFVFSLACGIGINCNSFDRLGDFPEETYNNYGHKVMKYGNVIKMHTNFLPKKIVELYGIYTGVNRASSYFSPNIGGFKYDFILSSNEILLDNVFESTEGKLRMSTIGYSLRRNFRDEVKRQHIIKTLGRIVFMKYGNINEIDAILQVQKYPLFEDTLSEGGGVLNTKQFDAFTICKL